MKVFHVGISDLNFTTPPNKIKTSGLGSCVGTILYDKKAKMGGISHTLLPDSTFISQNDNLAKFVDTAIPFLIAEMEKGGATKKNLQAAVFGGAKMFSLKHEHPSLHIGMRNTTQALLTLNSLSIPIMFNYTGGNKGRSITLDCETGTINLDTFGEESIFLTF